MAKSKPSPLPLVNIDARCKDMARAHPEQFMWFFFPLLAAQIDFSLGVLFLDKEMQEIFADWGKKGQRTGDLLMQWTLKNGQQQLVLAHVEFQQKPKPDFPRRVFLTSVRISEKYPQHKLAQLVLYTGPEVPKNRNFYEIKFIGGKTRHDFTAYIVREQDRRKLEADPNVFALVVLTCLVNIEQKKHFRNDFDWLLAQKIALMRLCLQRGFDKEEARNLQTFVSYMVALPKDEADDYKRQINNFVMKKERSITEHDPELTEILFRVHFNGRSLEERDAEVFAKMHAESEARIRTESEARIRAESEAIGHILRMHQKGFASEVIADLLDKDLAFVEATIQTAVKP